MTARGARGHLPAAPQIPNLVKLLRALFFRPPETHAISSRYRNTLRLTLSNEIALGLRDIAQYLEHEIGNQQPRQVAVLLTGVEERHIKYDYRRAALFCYYAPLLKYFRVISAESVDTLYVKRVSGLYPLYHPYVRRAVEIFAGLLVLVNIFRRDAALGKRYKLPVLFLIPRRYARITEVSPVIHTYASQDNFWFGRKESRPPLTGTLFRHISKKPREYTQIHKVFALTPVNPQFIVDSARLCYLTKKLMRLSSGSLLAPEPFIARTPTMSTDSG
jgi:hypothetical protein